MKVYIDGAGALLHGQKGKTAVVIDYELKERPLKESVRLHPGPMTNNVAEYKALLEALTNEEVGDCTVNTDSRLLAGQLTMGWKVKAAHLKDVNAECKRLLVKKNCKLVWVPREHNLAGKLLERKIG